MTVVEYNTDAVQAAKDQPQGLLDLTGMSFRLWRRNLKFLVTIFLWPTVFVMLAIIGFQCCLAYGPALFTDFGKATLVVCGALLCIGVFLTALLVAAVRLAALIRLTNGFASDWLSATTYCNSRIPALIGISLISFLMLLLLSGIWGCSVGLAVAISTTGPAGGIAGLALLFFSFLGGFISLIIFVNYCYMLLPVLACEEISMFSIIGRAFQLLFSRHFFRIIAFSFIMFVIIVVVAAPFTLPISIILSIDQYLKQGTGFADFEASLPATIGAQFFDALSQIILRPISGIAYGLFYLSLRQTSDGLDIKRRLKALKESGISER